MMRRAGINLVLLVCLSFATGVNADTPPATMPTGTPPMLVRMETALVDVPLSDDQRTKVNALLADLRNQLRDVESLSPEDRRDTLRQVMGEGRRKLGEILSVDQQTALRDRIQQLAQPAPDPTPTPAPKVRPTEPVGPAAPMMGQDMGGNMAAEKPRPQAKPDAAAPIVPAVAAVADVTTGAIGQPFPACDLKRVGNTGAALSPKAIANKVTVIEFGSYSAPSFRYRSASMDALAKQYGSRGVDFYVVYTAEAYPEGEWDIARNRNDNVLIARHPDYATRTATATRMRDILRPNRTVVVDDFDTPLAKAVRAGPHTVLVIGRDGTIAARQQWCDPNGLVRHIDAAIANRPQK